MNKRKRKRKQFQLNLIKKRMRQLRRKNKRNRITLARRDTLAEEDDGLYGLLSNIKFSSSKYSTRSAFPDKRIIVIPEVFSFTDNPEGTIKTLKTVYSACSDTRVHSIIFSHRGCKNLGIGASTVMDTLVMTCINYKRANNIDFSVSGDYPEDGRIKRIFVASGLPEHLNVSNKARIRKDNLKLFKIVRGKHALSKSGAVATELTDYYNECLSTQGFHLTPLGVREFSSMFAEVINNCELHGGESAIWYALGHYEVGEHEYGEANLVIFNYGMSIYEQLLKESTEETTGKLEYMKKKHIDQFDKNWTVETLYTVYALQGNVSRLRGKDEEGSKKRGTGTVRLLNAFKKLGRVESDQYNQNPRMSITSGHTHIIIDEDYELKEQYVSDTVLGDGIQKVIAFNKENDLFIKADSSKIKHMKEFFPGTVICMKFYVDKSYLNSQKGDK